MDDNLIFFFIIKETTTEQIKWFDFLFYFISFRFLFLVFDTSNTHVSQSHLFQNSHTHTHKTFIVKLPFEE